MADFSGPALGFVETRGLIGAIAAADSMAKTAAVRIIGIEKVNPALMTVKVRGDVASVQAAVDAGAATAVELRQLVSTLVIPFPAPGLEDVFLGTDLSDNDTFDNDADNSAVHNERAENFAGTGARFTAERLTNMTVVELRSLARGVESFPLQGRAIAGANKQQLLDAFAAHRNDQT